MNTTEPTGFPTDSPSLYNITYPEPTGNYTPIPVNDTVSFGADAGRELLWITVTIVGGAIVTCLTCIGGIFLRNKCLADFDNFRRGGEPHWLCEWMNREKYNKAREGHSLSRGPEDPTASETKDDDDNPLPHTRIEMTITSGSETIHAVIDSNSAATALAAEVQIFQDLLLRRAINEDTKQSPVDSAPSVSSLEDGTLVITIGEQAIGGGNNTAYDI